MANFPGGTALSGKDGENAAKAATVEKAEPQTEAPVETPKKAEKPEPEGDKISVFLSRMVYQNPVTHNSESVKQVQRRLVGLGFVQAGSDPAGLFADGTQAAVEEYQAKHDIDAATPGEVDAQTLKALFRNAKGIDVILD